LAQNILILEKTAFQESRTTEKKYRDWGIKPMSKLRAIFTELAPLPSKLLDRSASPFLSAYDVVASNGQRRFRCTTVADFDGFG